MAIRRVYYDTRTSNNLDDWKFTNFAKPLDKSCLIPYTSTPFDKSLTDMVRIYYIEKEFWALLIYHEFLVVTR